MLPVYLRLSKHVPAAQAFGGPVLLLIWLYVMANVIVFGAEINWRRAALGDEDARPAACGISSTRRAPASSET